MENCKFLLSCGKLTPFLQRKKHISQKQNLFFFFRPFSPFVCDDGMQTPLRCNKVINNHCFVCFVVTYCCLLARGESWFIWRSHSVSTSVRNAMWTFETTSGMWSRSISIQALVNVVAAYALSSRIEKTTWSDLVETASVTLLTHWSLSRQTLLKVWNDVCFIDSHFIRQSMLLPCT